MFPRDQTHLLPGLRDASIKHLSDHLLFCFFGDPRSKTQIHFCFYPSRKQGSVPEPQEELEGLQLRSSSSSQSLSNTVEGGQLPGRDFTALHDASASLEDLCE